VSHRVTLTALRSAIVTLVLGGSACHSNPRLEPPPHVLSQTHDPHEAWFKRKPDISHLRVWGCLAYVHVQKDKRRSLEPHMEKCVFVGYPSGYKGWKFYNPITQKYVISERTEFDECVFPGLAKYKATSPVNLTPPNSVLAPTLDPLLHLGGG
jgi:hypothetical protein